MKIIETPSTPNPPSSKRYGLVIMTITIAILIVVMIFYAFLKGSDDVVAIRLGQWTQLNVDGRQFKLDPIGRWVDYQIVVNEVFTNPIIITRKSSSADLGSNIQTLHVALIGSKGPKEAKFSFETMDRSR